mmetsp:Transcript_19887/g.42401  ORF Transcript_19887/g.42401 Transcript_19887/m.42401 type:complete len:204 (+) Transcript_19887:531-1142(+)
MVGCNTRQMPPPHNLHATIPRVGVQERHPCCDLELVPAFLIQISIVLVPWHGSLSLTRLLRRFAAQVPDRMPHDLDIASEDLLCRAHQVLMTPKILNPFRQDSILVQEHICVRKLLIKTSQSRKEVRILTQILDLSGFKEPLGYFIHQAFDRLDSRVQDIMRHYIMHNDESLLMKLGVLLLCQWPRGPLILPRRYSLAKLLFS